MKFGSVLQYVVTVSIDGSIMKCPNFMATSECRVIELGCKTILTVKLYQGLNTENRNQNWYENL
jgi:hypothetical protein